MIGLDARRDDGADNATVEERIAAEVALRLTLPPASDAPPTMVVQEDVDDPGPPPKCEPPGGGGCPVNDETVLPLRFLDRNSSADPGTPSDSPAAATIPWFVVDNAVFGPRLVDELLLTPLLWYTSIPSELDVPGNTVCANSSKAY